MGEEEIYSKACSFLDEGYHASIVLLKSLVEINSFTANKEGTNKVQSILAGELRSIGMNVQRIPRDGIGDILIARNSCREGGRVLLSVHADTVHPPESDFKHFSIQGDRAYGPGVHDMKGSIVMLLQSLRALERVSKLDALPITLIINSDEEMGSGQSCDLIHAEAALCQKAFVLEPGRPNDALVTRRKGIYHGRLFIHGRAAHAGLHLRSGASAVEYLARLIVAIKDLTDFETGVTTNFGKISGGTVSNVVADYAEACFELRAEDKASFRAAVERVSEICSQPAEDGIRVELREEGSVPPLEESEESLALLEEYVSSGKRVGIDFSRLSYVSGGISNANDVGSVGIPCIDGLGPHGEGAHTKEECLYLPSFLPRARAFVSWFLDECQRRDSQAKA